MKIQFIKPHHKYSYFSGDVADLNDETAKSLIASGHVKVPEKEDKTEKTKDAKK